MVKPDTQNTDIHFLSRFRAEKLTPPPLICFYSDLCGSAMVHMMIPFCLSGWRESSPAVHNLRVFVMSPGVERYTGKR